MAFRLQLQAVPGETMNQSRLQVDTVRYFTAAEPQRPARPRPAPAAGTYDAACPEVPGRPASVTARAMPRRVVPQAGVEPATFRLGGGCSIR